MAPRSPGDNNGRLEVVVLNRQRRRFVPGLRLQRVLEGAARALNVSGEIAIVVCGDRLIQDMNRKFRAQDKPTDVLSFPAGDDEPGELGDVVISLDTADRNAAALGRTLEEELDVLALHGFLHVLGYDHETDDGEMEALEQQLRRDLLGMTAFQARKASTLRPSALGTGRKGSRKPAPLRRRS